MKKIIVVIVLIISSMSPAQAHTGCDGVKMNPSITKGAVLQCLTGDKSYIFESIQGPAIVNFWGSWCAPCLDEIPYLRAFAKKYPKIAMIGVDVEERRIADGRAFATKHRMNWPNFYDATGSTRGITGVGVPITLLIDASGKIRHKKIGVLRSLKELESLSKKYLSS